MIKALLKLRVKRLLKAEFQKAETFYRIGNGLQKLDYVVAKLAKRMILPQQKDLDLLREIVSEAFEEHKDEINNMIIRTPIII